MVTRIFQFFSPSSNSISKKLLYVSSKTDSVLKNDDFKKQIIFVPSLINKKVCKQSLVCTPKNAEFDCCHTNSTKQIFNHPEPKSAFLPKYKHSEWLKKGTKSLLD